MYEYFRNAYALLKYLEVIGIHFESLSVKRNEAACAPISSRRVSGKVQREDAVASVAPCAAT